MSAHDDMIKALRFDGPTRIPVSVGLLPATWIRYREELDALVHRHPILFGESVEWRKTYDDTFGTYTEGLHTDIWGCVWQNVRAGMEGFVVGHPLPTRESVRKFKGPTTTLGVLPHGFMFLYLTYLRGFEQAMVDFAEEPPELQMLIDVVLAHNMKELELILAKQSGPIVYFGDDLGMQDSLPISPEKWRKYLKPCYAKMYGRCRDAGFYVYMHSDGHMLEIIPDLIECGVNVINPQVGANGLENLARVCKRKVCVDLDLDRQMFPFWSPEDIDRHVREAVETLGLPEGGLWLKAECGPDVPLRNIEAICMALEKYRGYFT